MQDPNHQEREEQLRQREIDLRLRELEVEIYQSASPFHPTSKNTSSNNNKPVRTFKRDVVIATKFSGFFFASVIVVFISQ